MDSKLYLLKDEIRQVNFKTKTKYLYSSELNRLLVQFMESSDKDFFYLSNNFGIISPNKEIEPYTLGVVSYKARHSWSLVCAEWIRRICSDMDKDTVVFMMSGNVYDELEEKLRWFGFKIESPLKYYKTSELKKKWIYKMINKNIENGLII